VLDNLQGTWLGEHIIIHSCRNETYLYVLMLWHSTIQDHWLAHWQDTNRCWIRVWFIFGWVRVIRCANLMGSILRHNRKDSHNRLGDWWPQWCVMGNGEFIVEIYCVLTTEQCLVQKQHQGKIIHVAIYVHNVLDNISESNTMNQTWGSLPVWHCLDHINV